MRLDSISHYYTQSLQWFIKLSDREKGLIIASFLVIVPLFTYNGIIVPIKNLVSEQSASLEKISQDLKVIPHILDRHKKLLAKKTKIESDFRQVEIKEGEKTLLENIISGKADPGFQISPLNTTPFGGEYEQAPFTIKFSTPNLPSIIEILEKISTGEKRMVLTMVSMQKSRTGDKFDIQLSASSIRKVTK